MTAQVLWAIGSPDEPSSDLVDNYRSPALPGSVVWRVPAKGAPPAGQQWPLFHPSEADPEAGYQLYPYTVEFDLDGHPRPAYRLKLHYLVIAPRIGHVEIQVNGVSGRAYLRPTPSTAGRIWLQPGLHTTLYSEGTCEVLVPGNLLRAGANRLTLICHDGAAVTPIESVEKIRRLDRMATGAGFVYRALEFEALREAPPHGPARAAVVPSVIYRRDADGQLWERCHVYVEFARAFEGGTWSLEAGSGERRTAMPLQIPPTAFGQWQTTVDVPDADGPIEYCMRGQFGDETVLEAGSARRRRKWKVYITPHLHTDIGYTHRQWEVAERLSHNLDQALEYLRADGTSGAPPAFAYHLDSAWALDTYQATRNPARMQELLEQAKARRLGIPANYVILLSQLAALEDLIRNGVFTDGLLQPAGMRSRFAAVVDVPSLTRSLPDVLAASGVRYLIHASNQDRGPFRVNGGLHRKSPFYWEGLAGGRVLTWLSKMYCELRKVCGSPPDLSAGERGLGAWLDEYERDSYAPDAVLLYGQEADNTDLDPQPIDFVREWNATYAYPRLEPCDVSVFFEHVEGEYAAELPVLRGDGGAYWEDGALSTLAATLQIRQAQADLPAAERLAALAALHHAGWAFPQAHFDEAWRQVLLYDEHTWGAFLSGSDPAAWLQRDQWGVKEHMARDAAQWSARLLHSAATRHSLSWNTTGREVVVYNPHSWPVDGVAQVEVARDEVVVDAISGERVPQRQVKVLNSQATVEFRPQPLDGLSYRRYGLRPRNAGEGQPPTAQDLVGAQPVTLENEHYRLVIDVANGCVTSWWDKALERELVLPGDWGLGRFLYAEGGEGTRLLSNHASLPDGEPTILARFELDSAVLEQDALAQRVQLEGAVAAGRLAVEWVLPHGRRQVEVRYRYDKEERLANEAAYIAFPLDLPGARVRSDSQLGWVDWAADRLPGACLEWLPLQSSILAGAEGAEVLINSPDIPLFCVGDIVRGRWPRELDLTGGRLFSYVLNNYWRVNYKASQGGPLTFRYCLTSDEAIARDRAYRVGWEARRPLYAQRLSLQEFRGESPPYEHPAGGWLARVEPEQVALSTMKGARDGRGLILRVQEIAGAGQQARVGFPGRRVVRAWLSDLLEHDIHELPVQADGSLVVPVPAWGLATARVELAP